MTMSTEYSTGPQLAAAELAELRSELENDLRRLTMLTGYSDGGASRLDVIAQARSGRILSALARMEDGTYGSCLGCGDPIPYSRLIAIPEATACFHCIAGMQ